MLLLVAELVLAIIALTTLSYITAASPEEHEEHEERQEYQEHQEQKLAPLPRTEARTKGPRQSYLTTLELARRLDAAEAKLAVRDAELVTERAARAAAEQMAATALVAAAEKEAALQAILSFTTSRTGKVGSDTLQAITHGLLIHQVESTVVPVSPDPPLLLPSSVRSVTSDGKDGKDGSSGSDGRDRGSSGLRWLGRSCDAANAAATAAPKDVAAGWVTPHNFSGSLATPALSGTISEASSIGATSIATAPLPPPRGRLVDARSCGLKSRSCGAVAAAIASSSAGADRRTIVNRDGPAPRPPPPPQPLIALQRRLQRREGWLPQW